MNGSSLEAEWIYLHKNMRAVDGNDGGPDLDSGKWWHEWNSTNNRIENC